MTLRPLPRSRLTTIIPPLLEAQSLVALVPATGDLRWAAETAWQVARAAALSGGATGMTPRRVTLVDLWLEDPKLHEVISLTPGEGIVDAFAHDVSLTKAAHQIDPVYFIAAGSHTASPGDVYAHPRWTKLHAGFRAEGALLLVYLSPAGLARLSATPDGILALAPEGVELESAAGRGIAAAVERGIPAIGVVRERWSGVQPARLSPPAVRRPSGATARRTPGALPFDTPGGRGRRVTWTGLGLAGLLSVGAAAVWLVRREGPEPATSPVAAAAVPAPPSPGVSFSTDAVESLTAAPWTVQLAAYGSLQSAMEHVDAITHAGLTAFVTPVMLEPPSTVWYRVCQGLFGSEDDARQARRALWRRRLTRTGEGILLQAPYSLLLAADTDLDSLRRAGIPAFPWGPSRRVLVGAFETPEQASFAAGQLERQGWPAQLASRTGAPR